MCGLAGLLDRTAGTSGEELRTIAGRMAQALAHRGPDDRGVWTEPRAGIALGFRRLAIVDLSMAGHQPMPSASGRYVLVFNGEIYNHQELRAHLQPASRAPKFRGTSDTEVMLAAFDRWGVIDAVRRFRGMFAFALWDSQDRVLHLARDRVGEKPLYYGMVGDTVFFASELQALKVHPLFSRDVCREALVPYLRHGYVPAPYSIYKAVHKLPAATILSIKSDPTESLPCPVTYWSMKEHATAGMHEPFSGSEDDAIEQVEDLLRDAVREQMIADVPLGAFLSGGIDSSTVVALMQRESKRPIQTFTAGVSEAGFNESGYARAVANFLGTRHTDLQFTPSEAMAGIGRLPSIYGEPFGDPSAIPTCSVARLARSAVKVALSGDGADELFGGYAWHSNPSRVHGRVAWIPRRIRAAVANAMEGVSTGVWDGAFAAVRPVIPSGVKRLASGDKMHQIAVLVRLADSELELLRVLNSKWNGTGCIVLGARSQDTLDETFERLPRLRTFPERAMLLDLLKYLPDNHMAKVDRASMAVGLETRAPFLDHRLVEFAFRLPLTYKIRNGSTKDVLRRLLHRYVPPRLVERKKIGFTVPIGIWLRGPLREWAEALIDERGLRREGYLDHVPIRRKWTEHLAGSRDWSLDLWRVLMFQEWLTAH